MFQFFLILHIIICLGLISLVLIQHGKGADIGASFGASQTLFGAQGSGTFLTKFTSILAVLFFVNCLWLGYLGSHQQVQDPLRNIDKVSHSQQPVTTQQPENKLIKE